MERKTKIYTTFVFILMILALTLILMLFKQKGLTIITITLLGIAVLYIVILLISGINGKDNYEKEVKYILKTYQNILVKSIEDIDLSNKNIIKTDNIEDLANAQVEIRKPIYYKSYEKYTIFILIDNKEALVYIIKENEFVEDAITSNNLIVNLNDITNDKTFKLKDKTIYIKVVNDEEKDNNLSDDENKDMKRMKKGKKNRG